VPEPNTVTMRGPGNRPTPASSPGNRDGQVGDRRADGPLPSLLLGMTVVTGLVDAFSYLSLAHVFVANMTGNVVFLGFGLAGAGNIAVTASLVAILGFALGAAAGGRWALPRAPHRGRLLATAATVEAGLVVAAAVAAQTIGVGGSAVQLTLVSLLAVAMGGQNAVARRLAVPDRTTTVLTLTVTGLVADATSWSVRFRRLVPIVAMLGGAFAGGALLHWVSTPAPLWVAAAVLLACAVIAHAATRAPMCGDSSFPNPSGSTHREHERCPAIKPITPDTTPWTTGPRAAAACTYQRSL
jgi:uncharacterized membrane protein YoaK (UPF0700 family)